MSLIHMKGSISRSATMAALILVPAASALAFAPPQVTTTTTTPAPARAQGGAGTRSRCMGCSDSARAKHDMLLNKLDSLRWEFSNRRLTPTEQEVFVKEMSATMIALQQFMEANAAQPRRA